MVVLKVLLVISSILVPFLSLRLQQKGKLPNFINPVLICYAFGIVLNITIYRGDFSDLAGILSNGSILLALPLLLIAEPIKWKHFTSNKMLTSFLICLALTSTYSILYAQVLNIPADQKSILAGMTSAVYSGGLINLFAVGKGLGAGESLLFTCQTADIITGAVLFLFFVSLGRAVFSFLLDKKEDQTIVMDIEKENPSFEEEKLLRSEIIKNLGTAILLVLVAVLLTYLINPSHFNEIILFICLTAVSMACSYLKPIKKLKGKSIIGEYFVLVFSITICLKTNLLQSFDEGKIILLYYICVLISIVTTCILIYKLIGINSREALLTLTAALYGPPFVPQIAKVTGAKQLMPIAITLGVLGLGLGNFLGFFIAGVLPMIE